MKSVNSIDDALKFLDELSESKQSEFKDFVSEKVERAKEVVSDSSDFVKHFSQKIKSDIDRVSSQVKDEVNEQFSAAMEKMNSSARANPYLYLSGAAIGGIALGYFLGQQSKTRETRDLGRID